MIYGDGVQIIVIRFYYNMIPNPGLALNDIFLDVSCKVSHQKSGSHDFLTENLVYFGV